MITYSKVYEDIADTLNKDNLDDVIPGRVRLAELAIYRRLNIDLNLKTATLAAADDPINPIALPSDYKVMRQLTANGYPLDRITDENYRRQVKNYTGPNVPWAFTDLANSIYILPWPDETPADGWDDGTEIVIDYYGFDSAPLMNMGYDAFLYGGLWHMAIYMKAPVVQISLYENSFSKAILSLDYAYRQKQYSGSTKQVTSAYG